MKMNALILLLILCSSSCVKLVDHVYSIKIQNNTNNTVLFFASYTYPDTSITNEKPILKMVYPSKYSYLDSKEKWEEVLSKDTITIFILSMDTVNKYEWDIIRDNYNILKRYDVSLNDLENQNWTITYP